MLRRCRRLMALCVAVSACAGTECGPGEVDRDGGDASTDGGDASTDGGDSSTDGGGSSTDGDLVGDGDADALEPDSDVPAVPSPGCAHFVPGNYFREVDSVSRRIDGLGNITWDLTGRGLDLSDFVGIVVQIDWAMLETERGVYDFSHVDDLMDVARANDMHIRLKIMDRTFWDGCDPEIPFLPPYVGRVASVSDERTCYADTWNESSMDGYIALHIALALRYDDDPVFAGFNSEETAMGPPDGIRLTRVYYGERVRFAQELFAAAPQAIFISEFNWPLDNDVSNFSDMVDASALVSADGWLNAMGISWPDSWLNLDAYTADELSSLLSPS